MEVNAASIASMLTPQVKPPGANPDRAAARELAAEFLGSTFYRVLMKSMRKTVPESVFFGSYANRVFQDFLDNEFSGFLGRTQTPLLERITDYIHSSTVRGRSIDVRG